jgi:hypothetical protein
MINPRTSTEFWDNDELEAPLHFPHATRRRALIAHSLGVLGVLGTLALGVAAIGPHLSWVTHKAHTLLAPERPAQDMARPAPLVAAPAAPPVTAENTATAQVEPAPPPAVPAPVVTPPEPPSAPAVVPAPSTDVAALAPLADTAPATPAPADTAPTTPAPAETTAATPAVASTAPVAKTLVDKPAADKPTAAVASPRPVRTEPRLTWSEIERRKARYDAWLKNQGLEPVH